LEDDIKRKRIINRIEENEIKKATKSSNQTFEQELIDQNSNSLLNYDKDEVIAPKAT